MRIKGREIFVVMSSGDDDRSIKLVSTNLATCADYYFAERSKINGERPYVYRFKLGVLTNEGGEEIGFDELYKIKTGKKVPTYTPADMTRNKPNHRGIDSSFDWGSIIP